MSGVPILLVGAGRIGGALLTGWRETGVAAGRDILIRDPLPGEAARAAAAGGARLNPSTAAIGEARTIVLAMKPQGWREAVGEIAAHAGAGAIVVSLLAGVDLRTLGERFGGRSVARAMPTTAIAVRRGPISLAASDARAAGRAGWLFAGLGEVIDLGDEALMDAATAASGSGPAYLYAFVEALADAGADAGLPTAAAGRLARSTVIGAAALMAASETSPAELRARVASPGGTTEAGLEALAAGGLGALLKGAVAAAADRSRQLGGR